MGKRFQIVPLKMYKEYISWWIDKKHIIVLREFQDNSLINE